MGKPIEIKLSISIDASPQSIWERLVGWESIGDWMLEADGVRVTSKQREGVGTRAVATIKIGGISTLDPIEVTGWDPPRRLEVHHNGWVKGWGEMVLEPGRSGTELHWKEVLTPPWGPLGAIGIRLFRPIMKKTFERDAKALKELLEREG